MRWWYGRTITTAGSSSPYGQLSRPRWHSHSIRPIYQPSTLPRTGRTFIEYLPAATMMEWAACNPPSELQPFLQQALFPLLPSCFHLALQFPPAAQGLCLLASTATHPSDPCGGHADDIQTWLRYPALVHTNFPIH